MIYKHFETQKINFNLNRIILLYGKNEGLKKEGEYFMLDIKGVETKFTVTSIEKISST